MTANGLIPVGSSELYLETSGSGPPVLFIHAGVADSRMWDRQFDALSDFHLIRFDMRGFGRSSLGSEPFTNHHDVLAVLDHLGVDRAVLVGCSIGAGTALHVADEEPGRVAGLVLVGADAPGFDPGIDYQSPEWPEALRAFEKGDLMRVAQLDAEMWLAGRDRSTSDLDPSQVGLFVEMDLIALANETERDELDAAEPLDRLTPLDVPVLVVVGDRDLPQLIAAADHLAALSDTPVTTIRDSAHLPSMDKPDEFNEALLTFLAAR